eukprot:comp22606_c0_seq1/m.34689 comp22606_c0_seq1/g.34689  ORF comp22606_c0_seq1/g.34689 comp22606_c0_seq1/m.34689 type:complete len:229 (-) comp22606_c0_seq1:215-901(-)
MSTTAKKSSAAQRRLQDRLDEFTDKGTRELTLELLVDFIIICRNGGTLKNFAAVQQILNKTAMTPAAKKVWEAEKKYEPEGKQYAGKQVETSKGPISALLKWRAEAMQAAAKGGQLGETEVHLLAALLLHDGSLDETGKRSLDYLQENMDLAPKAQRAVAALAEQWYKPEKAKEPERPRKRKAQGTAADVPAPVGVISVKYSDRAGHVYKMVTFDAAGTELNTELLPA